MEDIYQMSKKELKEYINKNGGFLNMKLNFIDTNKRGTPTKYQESIPEGATYFEAIASTGELNRNGYIIRPEAWKKSISNFLENGVVLYQHDTERPIGKPLRAEISGNGELKVGGYINDTNNYSQSNIFNGNVTGISTGHILEAVEFENEETGEILSEEDFLKEHEYIDMGWFGTYITPGRLLAVTEADWLEFSFVTLASNKKSRVKYINGIQNYLENKGIQCRIGEQDGFQMNVLQKSIDDMKKFLENNNVSEDAKKKINDKITTMEKIIYGKNEEDKKEEIVVEEPVAEGETTEVVEETNVETPVEEVETEVQETEEKGTEEEVSTTEGTEEKPSEESVEVTETTTEENKVEINPYPTEHACRLRDPNDFQDGSFRRTTREHEGKEYDVIMGKLTGEDAMTDQAFRYKKDIRTEEDARKHCEDHDLISFEPASGDDKEGDEEKAKDGMVEKNTPCNKKCSSDCNDCPKIDCEENSKFEINKIEVEKNQPPEEEPKPVEEVIVEGEEEIVEGIEETTEEKVKEDTNDEEATLGETATEKPVETIEEPTEEKETEIPKIPETDGGEAVTPTDGTPVEDGEKEETDISNNSVGKDVVDYNAIILQKDSIIGELTNELTTNKQELENVRTQLNEANKMLGDGEKVIEQLSVLVNRAKKFEKEQGLNFSGSNHQKSALEKRIKFAY